MADKTGYIGRNPGDSSVTIARQTYTPTSNTTDFTFTSGYTVGLCDVYLNGVKLINGTDYDANTGSTVGLTSTATSGDVVEIVAYKAFNLGQVNSTSGDFTVAEKISVGSTSTLTGVVTTGGDLYVGGVIYGDGSNLTGIAATGNINTNNIKVSGISTFGSGASTFPGAVSITDSTASTSTTTGALKVTGGVGIAGSLHVGENVSIGGTLTYEDVTNIDSVGVVTAQLGVNVSGGEIAVGAAFSVGQAGVVTASSFVGNGANLTNLPAQATIANNADNRVITGGSGVNLNAESTLQFNGTRLDVDSSAQNILQLNSTNSDGPNVPFQRSGTGIGNVGSAAAITGGTAAVFAVGAATTLVFSTSGSNERARIDKNGRFIIGHNASTGEDRILQVVGTTADTSAAQIIRHSADSSSPQIDLTKSRNATKGSNTIVQDGDTLGQITFRGDDGTDLNSTGATIVASVDGTPGSNDMPGRLVFSTTPDGSAAETERMRITKTGAISLNNGELVERCYIQSSPAWSSNGAVDLDNGVVQYNTSNYGSGGAGSLYFTSSVGINTQMANGDIMSLTMMTNVNSTAGYINNIFIDGQAVTETWVGGSAPTAGGGSGVDIYTFNIIKTASATYTVIANQVLTSA